MLDAIKSANIANNILILKDLFYLEGVVAHGRASSSLAFAPVFSEARNHFRLRAFFVPGKAWPASVAPATAAEGGKMGARAMCVTSNRGHESWNSFS